MQEMIQGNQIALGTHNVVYENCILKNPEYVEKMNEQSQDIQYNKQTNITSDSNTEEYR